MEVHQRGRVEIVATHPVTVAVHHGLGEALEADWSPDRDARKMNRDRKFLDSGTLRGQLLCPGEHFLVDRALGIRMAESLP